MGKIVQHLGVLLGLMLVFHLGLVAVGLLMFPRDNIDFVLDAGADDTPMTTPQYLLYYGAALKRPGRKLVLLGPSTVQSGFRPKEIEARLPGTAVFNLSLTGMNMTEYRSMVDMVLERVSPGDAANITLVVALWYGGFADNATRWPDGITEIDHERLRFGLYRKASDRIEPAVPMSWMPTLTTMLLPVRALLETYRSVRSRMIAGFGNTNVSTCGLLTADGKHHALVLWRQLMGERDTVPDEQFAELVKLADAVSRAGVHLVLVDMPMPKWHAETSPLFHDYEKRKRPTLERLSKLANVSYVDLTSLDEDEAHYCDSSHPRPDATWRWADGLAAALRHQVASGGR